MQKVRKWALFWRLKFYLNFEKNSWISISNFSSVQKSTDEIEWYTLRTPDVSGHHCPCHISLSRFCPDFPKILFGVCCLDSVRVFCPGSVCLDSVGCLDSVRICVKKTVRYLSVRIFGLDFVRCMDSARTFQKKLSAVCQSRRPDKDRTELSGVRTFAVLVRRRLTDMNKKFEVRRFLRSSAIVYFRLDKYFWMYSLPFLT